MRVGYYVHHMGAGHRIRAQVLGGRLRGRGHEVTLLGSGPMPPTYAVSLADDAAPVGSDPTAGGALHWAPLAHPGYRERMAQLSEWLREARPDVVIVDVSVEVTALARLHGIPVVVMAQPGDRTDEPHTLAYRCATTILAPWPQVAQPCPALAAFADKVVHVGGLSRFAEGPATADRDPSVGLILGGGIAEAGAEELLARVRRSDPSREWRAAGGAGEWIDDIETHLRRASVVITHAGQNAIADLAATGTPAVVLPQDRPHDEQTHLADELRRLELVAVGSTSDAEPGAIPNVNSDKALIDLIARATVLGNRWASWQTEGAAERATAAIEAVA